MRTRFLLTPATVGALLLSSALIAQPAAHADASGQSWAATKIMPVRPARPSSTSTTPQQLSYHGGTAGTGVETGADRVYLVYWGSQWNRGDPSGEAALQQNFFRGIGGSSWNAIVTQYCQGVPAGTITCPGSAIHAVNPSNVLGGVWYDNRHAAPVHPSSGQIASEALLAARHFGNTTTAANTSSQYMINTATGNNSTGFGTGFCAWHNSVRSPIGTIAYSDMPYITDSGSKCGANFNGLRATAGITMVGGHEFAETETDMSPNTGWLDGSMSEIADKCSWISSGPGASTEITLPTGTFAVQGLWSNAYNDNQGGCVISE